MNEFTPRKIKFKAWDAEHRLLVRLDSIECVRGELQKMNHALLQFTGLLDKDGEEIYDQDILMISLERYIVFWNNQLNGWHYAPLKSRDSFKPLLEKQAATMKRFCNNFELTDRANENKR